MSEIAPFIGNISRKIKLDPENLDRLLSAFKMVRVKKKQFVIQPGFVAKQRMYVLKGAFRAFVIDEKGNDHTIQFAIEDWWISDYNSYVYQTPATQFVVALEEFPEVAQRLPQYALASYLNMTKEFLSKIRNDKVRKK